LTNLLELPFTILSKAGAAGSRWRRGLKMFVILTNEQILSTEDVCQGCLMADQSGAPRMRHGKLKCGRAIQNNLADVPTYQCQMGFRIAQIDS
jgi:hypothetical protein